MAQRQIKTTVEGNLIHFDGLGERVSFDTTRPNEETRAAATLNGWKQKLGDAMALDKGATVEMKRAALVKMVDQLYRNEWTAKATARGPAFNVGDVVLALARTKTGGDVDKASRAIDAYAAKHELGREEAAKLFRQDAVVGAEYDRIVRERKPVAFDADEAILEMETEPEADEGIVRLL